MSHAAILCRVSTEGQRDNTSIPEQRRILSELCQRQGWTFVVFEEVESGGAGIANRPILAGILGRIATGEFDRLVVLVQDRLTRSELGEIEQIAGTLAKVGAKLVTTSGEFDPRDPDHSFTVDMQAVFAKRERNLIRARTMRGRDAAVRSGRYGGGPIPYGYRKVFDPDGAARLVVDESEAAAVRRAFALYASGDLGAMAIGNRLRDEGFIYRGTPTWPYSLVERMLKNPRYAGREVWRRRKGADRIEVAEGPCPAIIDAATWERCERVRDGRRLTGQRRTASEWPLSGLLRCEQCGAAMVASQKYQSSRIDVYYRCNGANQNYRECSGAPSYLVELAHQAALDAIDEILANVPRRRQRQPRPEADPAASLRIELARIEGDEFKLFRDKDDTDPGQWNRLNRGLLAERSRIEAEIAALERSRPVTSQRFTPDAMTTLRKLLDRHGLIDDRATLRRLFLAVFRSVKLERTDQLVKMEGRRRSIRQVRVASVELVSGLE